jgi:hypothetical protein
MKIMSSTIITSTSRVMDFGQRPREVVADLAGRTL